MYNKNSWAYAFGSVLGTIVVAVITIGILYLAAKFFLWIF